ncbi:MAG: OmpA family protein, partial [Treponema sp.]|nr:OmpA family protein [Treponema sp.]
ISGKDALKILTQPDNVKLLEEGKVVILLDKPNLIYKVAVPEKTKSYYVKYEAVKQYFYENKIPVEVSDTIEGLRFSIQLNFYPDSEKLLPGETERLQAIATELQDLMKEDGYTILVEGHTADVGKPVGQLNLSIERTITVMNVLVDEGLDKSLFTYKGYGGTMPISTNATEEGRAQNRRVDITARPRATYIQKF